MTVLAIPITKAKRAIDVETDDLSPEVYKRALEEGLKVLLNKNMSKITTTGLEGDKLEAAQDAAYAKGLENFENIKAGKLGRAAKAGNASKVSGIVLTEARRLAKEVVKNEIKAAGMRISHVPASDITKAANALIESDPSFVAQAQANIESRAQIKPAINVASLVHADPKLVKADEDRKAARKDQLSAAKAGKTAPRKGAAQTNA